MKKGTIVLISVLAVVVILILSFIGSYNGLVNKSEKVQNMYSQIDVQLERRSDLIPNLVKTVQKYATHETEIFTEVANARAKLAGATNASELDTATKEFEGAVGRLLAIAENYPLLKANENFRDLQTQLEGTENRISRARQNYNDAVTAYNSSIRRFPTNILANLFGFESEVYFEASVGSKENPDVGDYWD